MTQTLNLLLAMKVLVDKKLEEGFTEIQIYDFLRERYGEWILYDPKLNKNTIFCGYYQY